MKKLITYFFCCFIFFSKGQNTVDSLLSVLKSQKEDTNKVKTLSLLAEYCAEEDVLKYSEMELQLAEKLNFKFGIANATGNLGFAAYNHGQIEKALDYFIRSAKILEEMNNIKGLSDILNNIGFILKGQGENDKALTYYLKAIKLLESTQNKKRLPFFLDNIGEIYSAKGNNKKALECYNRSLKIREETGDTRGLASSYAYFGVIFNKLKQPEKSLEYFHKALKIREELKDKHGIANEAGNIGAMYLQARNYKEAEIYLNRSLNAAKEIGFTQEIREASKHLSEIYKAQGNYKQAFEMHQLFKLMSDSINTAEIRNSTIEKQMQYEFEKKEEARKREAEIKEAVLQEEIKRQRLIYFSICGLVALGLLSVLLLFNRRRLKEKNKFQEQLNEKQKEQANAVMETQESERKRIAEDLHDSLGHLLSTTKLNLQTLPEGQKQVENSLNLLNQASEEIRNITFNLMPRTLEEGGLIPALNELANKVTNSGSVKVLLHVHDMEKFNLEKQSQFNIYRIVQEAVNNILKHANAKEINIQVIGQADHITIMIEDDGIGFNPEINKGGRGLKNIVTRSLWLKGNINIDSTPGRGTTITTEFPA